MTIFVESLKRLYESGKVEYTQLSDLKNSGKISDDELDYIITNE